MNKDHFEALVGFQKVVVPQINKFSAVFLIIYSLTNQGVSIPKIKEIVTVRNLTITKVARITVPDINT